MTHDVTRFQSNERVDLKDFLFAVDASLRSQGRHWGEQFLNDPLRISSGPNWILDGFGVTYLGAQLTVTRGRGILGQRETGIVYYGALTSEGDLERIIDVSSFANATYNVYIRFELLDGDSESRAFWDPSSGGSEFAQTIPTRRLANWSVRAEISNPGAEWIKLGTAVVATGVVTGVTQERDFFFEGEEDNSYPSTWSTDGGGLANDRNADRATYGVKDLHTFVAATRQCLEDIKGRGLRRWWNRDIGGLNIGFDANPVEDRIALGSADFYLDYTSADVRTLMFSASEPTYLRHTLSTNLVDLVVSGSSRWAITDAYGETTVPYNFHSQLAVGYDAVTAPVANMLSVGDANFGLDFTWTGGGPVNPVIRFDVDDYISFSRAGSVWKFIIGAVIKGELDGSGLRIPGIAIDPGMAVAPVDNTISIGDADFKLYLSGLDPYIAFDDKDSLYYLRSGNIFTFQVNNTKRLRIWHDTAGSGITKLLFSATSAVQDYLAFDLATQRFYFNTNGTDVLSLNNTAIGMVKPLSVTVPNTVGATLTVTSATPAKGPLVITPQATFPTGVNAGMFAVQNASKGLRQAEGTGWRNFIQTRQAIQGLITTNGGSYQTVRSEVFPADSLGDDGGHAWVRVTAVGRVSVLSTVGGDGGDMSTQLWLDDGSTQKILMNWNMGTPLVNDKYILKCTIMFNSTGISLVVMSTIEGHKSQVSDVVNESVLFLNNASGFSNNIPITLIWGVLYANLGQHRSEIWNLEMA